MTPYVLVSGDFVTTGGMDRANYALASYLAHTGHSVQLVAHRVAAELLSEPGVRFEQVPKPAGSYFLGGFCLDRRGRRCAAALAEGGRAVVNGGNCLWGDVNWVHYVHAAYDPLGPGTTMSAWKRALGGLRHRCYRRQEYRAVARARVVIVNSERTRRDVVERQGVAPERVHVVYYGVDANLFRPAGAAEQTAARQALHWPSDVPIALFVGALGDRRKGFDTLFTAWRMLCETASWDVILAVIGAGAERAAWERRAVAAGLAERIRFLGFRSDVARILAAADLLVSPTRYEAYGLGVHESLCCGIPALVSAAAGVAERYPADLHELLIPNPDDATDLVQRLQSWRQEIDTWKSRVAPLGEALRAQTWDHMAAEIVRLAEWAHPDVSSPSKRLRTSGGAGA